jgi:outer membrane protein assembly factor BamB
MNALDAATGGKLWTWAVPDKTTRVTTEDYASAVLSAPMVADGRVFFTSYTGFVYCLRAEKTPKGDRLVFKEKIAEQVCMTVPMAYEGAVFVRGENATFKFGAK